MRCFLTFVYILYSFISLSQNNFNKTWYNGGGRTFSTQFTTNGTINLKIDSTHARYIADGASMICDSSGNMLICSDGYNIYDKNLNYIDGGYRLVVQSFRSGWSGYL